MTGRMVVLEALVGSHNYNLNTPESDEDWKYFVNPCFDDLYFGKSFSSGSQSDDHDYTIHDIRQLSNLLWKANPNFVEVLFSQKFNGKGFAFCNWLLENRDQLSKMNLRSFGFSALGMHRERMSTLDKGTKKSQKLIDAFGYDTKDALHAYRCLLLAERVSTGMPMDEAFWFDDNCQQRQLLLNIKNGEVSRLTFESLVSDWHACLFDDVESFYRAQEPDEKMKERLDFETKDFIRRNL